MFSVFFYKMALHRLPAIHLYALPRVNRHAERNFRREISDELLYYNDCYEIPSCRHITRLLEDDINLQTNCNYPPRVTLSTSDIEKWLKMQIWVDVTLLTLKQCWYLVANLDNYNSTLNPRWNNVEITWQVDRCIINHELTLIRPFRRL